VLWGLRKRRRVRSFFSRSILLRSFEHEGDGGGEAVPVLEFSFELLFAGFGEGVELGFAVVFGGRPFGLDPAFVFEAVEGGVEGTLADLEGIFGDLLDALGDAPAVHGFEGEGP